MFSVTTPSPTGVGVKDSSKLHRHLNHEGYTLAAIDDIIARGKRKDRAELRAVALSDRTIMEKVLRVASEYASDRYAQRQAFWRLYAEKHLRTS